MAKDKKRKGYFYEKEEEAIIKYISETDLIERERIFNSVLHPALTKMIESIIRRYKLYLLNEAFEQTFNDTISYIMTKVDNFRPIIVSYDEVEYRPNISYTEMEEAEYRTKARNALPNDPEYIKVIIGIPKENAEPEVRYCRKVKHKYKAYSYCGTVCKHYLIQKNIQFAKDKDRYTPYDTVADVFDNNVLYSTDDQPKENIAQKLLEGISGEIKKMVAEPEKNSLTPNEVKVGLAMIDLFDRWEDILGEGSNKLQKSSVLYFLREETRMSTKELRDNMRKFKFIYKLLKEGILRNE